MARKGERKEAKPWEGSLAVAGCGFAPARTPPRDAISSSSRQAAGRRGSQRRREGDRTDRSATRGWNSGQLGHPTCHAKAPMPQRRWGVSENIYCLARGASLSWRWARHGFVQGFVVRAHPGDGQCQLGPPRRASESGGDDGWRWRSLIRGWLASR